MFTGIIAAVGIVTDIKSFNGDIKITIEADRMDMSDIVTGDSIGINGVCLTIVELSANLFKADVSSETLACTTFRELRKGARVNLEKALQLRDRLDGHIVTGHVDGTGTILNISEEARSLRYVIEIPESLRRYVCKKGSICVDGVSLTINVVSGQTISVNIIPHTMDQTIFRDYQAGSRVNLEVDIVARYLECLMVPTKL